MPTKKKAASSPSPIRKRDRYLAEQIDRETDQVVNTTEHETEDEAHRANRGATQSGKYKIVVSKL